MKSQSLKHLSADRGGPGFQQSVIKFGCRRAPKRGAKTDPPEGRFSCSEHLRGPENGVVFGTPIPHFGFQASSQRGGDHLRRVGCVVQCKAFATRHGRIPNRWTRRCAQQHLRAHRHQHHRRFERPAPKSTTLCCLQVERRHSRHITCALERRWHHDITRYETWQVLRFESCQVSVTLGMGLWGTVGLGPAETNMYSYRMCFLRFESTQRLSPHQCLS